MHTISTFLFSDAQNLNRERIFGQVRLYFDGWENVEFNEVSRPFGKAAALRVVVDGKYDFTVSYIDDEGIRESLLYVERMTATKFPAEKLVCEVRTNFGDDKDGDFDEVTISMYAFLEALPCALVYDDNQKKIVSNRI